MIKRANHILAATFGWDIAEVNECRYQRYVCPMVYSVGERYFAVSKSKPKHDIAGEWVEYTDQFFTTDTSLTVWVCDCDMTSAC